MKKLTVASNQLSTLPETIVANSPKLRFFKIGKNELTTLPRHILKNQIYSGDYFYYYLHDNPLICDNDFRHLVREKQKMIFIAEKIMCADGKTVFENDKPTESVTNKPDSDEPTTNKPPPVQYYPSSALSYSKAPTTTFIFICIVIIILTYNLNVLKAILPHHRIRNFKIQLYKFFCLKKCNNSKYYYSKQKFFIIFIIRLGDMNSK